MYILGIDTSCDETSVAVSRDDCILANVVYSQVEVHKKWGGVVPNLARINHQEKLPQIIQQALKRVRLGIEDVDAVAVTAGPGLAIALEVGIKKAKEICEKYHKKLIAVNHMEGHLLSSLIKNREGKPAFALRQTQGFVEAKGGLEYPGLALLVSGGHTQLVLVEEIGKYKIIGDTLDDAAGEAFDKVAKMLELGYPGGEIVERLAKEGKPIYSLPVPMLKSHDLNFSFSGLKTAAMYFLSSKKNSDKSRQFVCDFCASFEFVVVDSIRRKLEKALNLYPSKFILCGGGVVNNLSLRKVIRKSAKKFGVPAFFPEKKYCSDNAAMICVAGWNRIKHGEFVRDINKVDRLPNWEIDRPYV